jgi:hypothetical protein
MIKNELVSYQYFASKRSKEQITNLKKAIEELKNETPQNWDLIETVEKRLDIIVDTELRAEIEKNSKFEILNAEKITPHFVKLAKVGGGQESLNAIKDDNGAVFDSEPARHEYITNHYRKLFKERNDRVQLTENTIPDFLGPEICNSSIIKNSKLTNDEKLLLDNLFSVEELDQAVEDAKSTTAGGPDGIGNKCIKKIWPYIRVPLTNYANCCIEKEHLTDNFRAALIKLIPKKGDVSKIGNWRPISLLNCMYKVISKAITMRLQKISNRIFSRAQKGFTDDKYIQECLINIVETIKRCNDFNIPAFILAIDQAKAFDSVRHDFMRKCLEFFEVPERFIKILEIFTTNRTAAILLEGGKCSKTFDLEIGNTQGNGPSPIQFNICEQILLFKLELDPRIQSIYSDFANIPIILHQSPLKDF